MLTAIEIENFKGISDRVRVEFAPITLLFGANSAGKSTVLHAVQYLREVLANANVDATRTANGGEAIDLGGFRNLLHGRGSLAKTVSLAMEFDIWAEHFRRAARVPGGPILDLADRTARLEVEITTTTKGPIVNSYRAHVDGRLLFALSANPGTRGGFLDIFDVEHPILVGDADFDENEDEDAKDVFAKSKDWFSTAFESGGRPPPGMDLGATRQPPLALHQPDALPQDDFGDDPVHPQASLQDDWAVMSLVVEAFHAEASNVVTRSRYVGPLRTQPPRHFERSNHVDESRWWNGAAAWDDLLRADKRTLKEVASWMSQETKLSTGYRLEIRKYREVVEGDEVSAAVLGDRIEQEPETVRELFENLAVRTDFRFIEEATRLRLAPHDVGVGLSQLVPVVVAALKHADLEADLTCIEQPELHVHPAVQVGIADLLLRGCNRSYMIEDDPMERNRETPGAFLIETHSEHLILRLLRRIRETTDGELPPDAPGATPDDVAVYYVERTDDGPRFRRLRVGSDGDFIDRWPAGFFREREKELF